jgi:hypothetical protein
MLLGEWFRTSEEGSALALKSLEVLNMKADLLPFEIKALRSFETSGTTQLASRHVPEDVNPQTQGCEFFQY